MPKTYNKVDINGTTYIDLSNDTVSSENLVDGVTAHNRDGASITGSLIIPEHIVNTITTSAGAHTVITGEDGDVEFNVPTNVSHLTNDTGYITGMTILSYGNSTWQNFLDAYNSKRVVYCRASSNSDPATGSQTRLAFMAYVSNETTPTNVEFQYYRSVSSHTASQQGDQVYVYKLTNAGVWSVTVREASVKVAAGGNLTGSYSNGTYTVSGTIPDVSGKVDTSNTNSSYGSFGINYDVSGSLPSVYVQGISSSGQTGKMHVATAEADSHGVVGAIEVTDPNGTAHAGIGAVIYTNSNSDVVGDINLNSSGSIELVSGGDTKIGMTNNSGDVYISNLVTPTSDSDAATKKYVDDSIPSETDPVFSASAAAGISSSDISSWDGKFDKQDIIDIFYPVGTIYETVDTTFNPNTAWGGTWVQIQDKFLLAAGSTYHVGDSDGGSASISYTPEGSTGGTKLSDAQIAHGHSFTQPTITGGSHSHEPTTWNSNEMRFLTITESGYSLGRSKVTKGSTSDNSYIWSATTVGSAGATKSVSPSMTASGGAVGNLSGASSTRTTHNHSFTGTAATLDTMPPYTIVNIWKRTA